MARAVGAVSHGLIRCSLLRHVANDRRRNSGYERGRWDIMSHDGAGGDDGTRADVDPGQDRCSGPDPNIRADRDWLGGDVVTAFTRFNGMSGGNQIDFVGDHDVVGDIDGGVTRERALGTNEDPSTDGDVEAVVRVKGGDQDETVADGRTDELLEGFLD